MAKKRSSKKKAAKKKAAKKKAVKIVKVGRKDNVHKTKRNISPEGRKALAEAGRKGGKTSSRKGIKNRLSFEVAHLCEELGYDPAESLIVSRNRRKEEAENFLQKARDAKNPEEKLAYLSLVERQYTEMERIDAKMMEYRYPKLAALQVQPGDDGKDTPAYQLMKALGLIKDDTGKNTASN